MSKLKPCPLCGDPVMFDEEFRLLAPEQNQLADKWHGSSRVKIRCDACYLKMDVSMDGDYNSEFMARVAHAATIDTVKHMWNRRANDGTD